MLPASASRVLLDCAERQRCPVVFGKSRRSDSCPNIGTDAAVVADDDALAFAAERKIVRMGFLAERRLWEMADGADERIFIQDQSLPLRLAAAAPRLAYIEDYVYILRPAGEGNLSVNKMQQHHDRFFSLLPFIDRPGVSARARKALVKQMVSTLWKIERDSRALPFLSPAMAQYLLNRKKEELAALERQHNATIEISVRPDMLPSEHEMDFLGAESAA